MVRLAHSEFSALRILGQLADKLAQVAVLVLLLVLLLEEAARLAGSARPQWV